MTEYIAPLEKLIEQFRKLPGIGRKSAVRLAFRVLEFSDESAAEFAAAITEAKKNITECEICCNMSDTKICRICSDETRDRSTICVVEDIKAVAALEKVREYSGLYHVLHGAISPIDGITPDKLRIEQLIGRVRDSNGEIKEIILATNPNVEGETTAMYLTKLLKPLGVRISRLAYGIPAGGDLEYADEVTLFRAIEGRRELL
ncbi:MAG: recombination mediator RecR [Eubacteriales bacterium]